MNENGEYMAPCWHPCGRMTLHSAGGTCLRCLDKNSNEQCPVCGYYCNGKGGSGCIDKPSLITKKGDKQ